MVHIYVALRNPANKIWIHTRRYPPSPSSITLQISNPKHSHTLCPSIYAHLLIHISYICKFISLVADQLAPSIQWMRDDQHRRHFSLPHLPFYPHTKPINSLFACHLGQGVAHPTLILCWKPPKKLLLCLCPSSIVINFSGQCPVWWITYDALEASSGTVAEAWIILMHNASFLFFVFWFFF